MAAAAALAEYPDRVKKLFANKEYPEEGIFKLNLYVMGELINVIIDDRFPTKYKKPIHA